MSVEMVHLIVVCMAVLMSCCIGFISYNLLKIDLKEKSKNQYDKIKAMNMDKIQRDPQKRSSYKDMMKMMKAKGISYRMGAGFSPLDYSAMRFMVAVIFGMIFMFVEPVMGFAGLIVGYFIVPWYFNKLNEDDNQELLKDLLVINRIVALQSTYNVYLSKIIYECWFAVENPRLAKALLELSLDIENFSIVENAVKAFAEKFDSLYVGEFAKVLIQINRTGRSSRLLDDMESSLESINNAIAIKEKGERQRRLLAVSFCVLLIPLSVGGFLLTKAPGTIEYLF